MIVSSESEPEGPEAAEPPVPGSDADDAHDAHDVEPGHEGDAEPLEERRYPSTIGGAFYIVILLTMVAALVVTTAHDWRLGVRLLAGALVVAGALRLVLPQKDAGMLAVRHRLLDVVILVAMGVALWWLTGSIPNQPAP